MVCVALPLVGAGQLMPAGLEVTLPPAAATALAALTVSRSEVACWLAEPKFAVTVRAALIVTWQVVAVPEHAPPQPVKVLPVPGAAVSVTVVPDAKVPGQAVWVRPAVVGVVHDTPDGDELTVPVAVGTVLLAVTVRAKAAVVGAKVAVTLRAAVMPRVQLAVVPVQAPLQPVKRDPVPGVAVKVTFVPWL